MSVIQSLLRFSQVHDEWMQPLSAALQTMDERYLQTLLDDENWLPGPAQLFAAFRRDRQNCRYILFGESPYPRAESANGIAFYDAAVGELWSEKGLSKKVNRATSLRNMMKTALIAEQLISADANGKISQLSIAMVDKSQLIKTIKDLFDNLQDRGFLLCNTTPVLHSARKPALESRYWSSFVAALLGQVSQSKNTLPTLVLWGKIAQSIEALPEASAYPKLVCEHPYNLSFIHNKSMQQLFSSLKILHVKQATEGDA